jgi:hypothetical protein
MTAITDVLVGQFNYIMSNCITDAKWELTKERRRISLVDDDPDNNRIFTIALRGIYARLVLLALLTTVSNDS